MAITRITAVWSGFRGAPGYSNFYFAGDFADTATLEGCAAAVRSFFFAFEDFLPSSVTIGIRGNAEVIDEATGQIQSQADFEAPADVGGGIGDSYSAASGAVVNWNTNGYRSGRRVRGRTFLVPLGANAYDNQGDLNNTALGEIRNGAEFLSGGSAPAPFVVWSRGRNGAAGTAEPVVSHTVPDLGAVLRSRRD